MIYYLKNHIQKVFSPIVKVRKKGSAVIVIEGSGPFSFTKIRLDPPNFHKHLIPFFGTSTGRIE